MVLAAGNRIPNLNRLREFRNVLDQIVLLRAGGREPYPTAEALAGFPCFCLSSPLLHTPASSPDFGATGPGFTSTKANILPEFVP